MPEQKYPHILEEIIELLKSLPGVGKRSAERYALAMLKWDENKLRALGKDLSELHQQITPCPECGNLSTGNTRCHICESPSRDRRTVCVVEDHSQVQKIESSALFKGVYHVLGGKLSPLSGKHAEDLTIDALQKRVESSDIQEIILALSPDVEGQTTAVYIANLFKDTEIRITRLAQGLPAGSDISYVDSATIAAAFTGRTQL